MGFSGSGSSSSSPRDERIDDLKNLITKCMDLISQRNAMVEKLNGLDTQIEELMVEIKANPQAAEMAKMLSGLIKPTKRG